MSTATRSALVCFKFRPGVDVHGISLTLKSIDLNSVYSVNRVKQLFCTVENGVALVAIRFTAAIRHTRAEKLLEDLESKFGVQFQKPDGVAEWRSALYMGVELHSGAGGDIMQTLRAHYRTSHPLFTEHQSFGTHLTHLLRDPIRENRNMVSAGVEPAAPPAPADPVVPPPGVDPVVPAPAPSLLFRPPPIIGGQPNRVEAEVEMTERIADIVRVVGDNVHHLQLIIRAEIERFANE